MNNLQIKCKKCEVLKFAIKELDSYEYCIQELEKENEKLKEVLILSMWNKKE